MLLTKRKDHEFDGGLVAAIPKAPRSARGKSHRKQTVENGELFAIELLASLAGELLHENESSASSNASGSGDVPSISDGIKQEKCESVVKTENHDSGNGDQKDFVQRFEFPKIFSNGSKSVESDSLLERCSVVTSPCSIKKMDGDVSSDGFKSVEKCDSIHDDVKHGVDGFRPKMEPKFPTFLNPENGVKVSRFEGIVNNMFSLRHKNNRKIPRDNDERILRVNKSIFKSKSFRSSSYIGDRRVRKLLTSKYWKLAPKLKDYEHEPRRVNKRTLSENGALSYNHIYHRDASYKRLKYSGSKMGRNSDGAFNSDSVCNSPENCISVSKDSSSIMHEVNGVSSPGMVNQTSFRAKDSHVKFSIRSIRIPDLLIEVPETASIASLKRTVMEAFTSLVRDGLGVGVLLQGKKVRDDSRTLLQTGITSKENLNTLGFTLEPTDTPALPVNPLLQLSYDSSQLTTRSPASTDVEPANSFLIADPPITCLDNEGEDKFKPTSFPNDIVFDNLASHSNALVTVPPACDEPLAMIPLAQKSKRSDHVQRRTRRPFSVAEVEALVKAVEELGTGRWRDVKLRSFENADHRTYVDLKDKWKTLVHTAKISPQQRRGEPVPQELLDRVLAAHAFWSQNPKTSPPSLKISDSVVDRIAT